MNLKLKRRFFCQLMVAGATVAGATVAGFRRSNATIRSKRMKMHVFVDNDDNIVAITPAPVDVSPSVSPQAMNSGSVVFGGSSPSEQLAGMKRYELDMEKDLLIDFERVEVEQFHRQVIALIKARPELKPVYV